MLVQVVMFITGRMSLRLKTGVKALSSAGWFGSEQFTEKALHTAEKRTEIVKFRSLARLKFQQSSRPETKQTEKI